MAVLLLVQTQVTTFMVHNPFNITKAHGPSGQTKLDEFNLLACM